VRSNIRCNRLFIYYYSLRDKLSWEEVKIEMVEEKGLSSEVADKIGAIVLFKGSPKILLKELRDKKTFGSHVGANEALNDLEILFNYLDAMGSLNSVSFDLSLARGLDYYTGVIYEAVLTEGTSQVNKIMNIFVFLSF
jgi:histidyl-tRNA synthetase